MIDNLKEILNPEQYAAATAGDGPLLVLAAAGTGKTQTLVYRVAYLIEKGVSPHSILLLTFTNKAANEMLERAKATVGSSVDSIWSGTFHHICNRILRSYAHLLGYRNNFVIADRDDSRKLIEKAMKEVGVVGGENFPKRDVLASLFGNAVNRDIPLKDVLEEKLRDKPFIHDEVVRVFDVYTRLKLDDSIMDFDDMLSNAVRLFELKPEILNFYKRQFEYILVDEYQDTNAIQSKFVDMLAGENGNLMAVGDDFQCIYTWRGADFRNIMDFPRRYPSAQIIKLERNYRSTPEVLDVANACIACNTEQFQKTLRATHNHGDKPHCYFVRDDQEQSIAISALIKKYLAQGYRYGDMAVLYRGHFHSINLQMLLSRARIPFTITSGVGVFDSKHVKDLISLLRIINDPCDNLAFERFFMIMPGIGQQSVIKLWDKLKRKCDLSTEAGAMQLIQTLKPKQRIVVEPIIKAATDFIKTKAETGKEDIRALTTAFLDCFYTNYLKTEFDNPEERVDDILEVARQIEQKGALSDFLQDVALLTNDDAEDISVPGNRNSVRLSTIHQAKGLEWPIVFILWACEEMFPSARSIEDNNDDSEERRLFYVAVTRAKEKLNLFSPQTRRSFDNHFYPAKPSRFITEIPRGLLSTQYGIY